ncbi:MAG TPA: hypothetical protein VMM76_11350 [Pirellulaceae bacterium]|nr:hypothetical protein [Pirellulaceae bacterium]
MRNTPQRKGLLHTPYSLMNHAGYPAARGTLYNAARLATAAGQATSFQPQE